MSGLELAGSAVGVVSLGITVCQGLTQYYGSWKDSRTDVSKMLSSVTLLTSTLKLLQQKLSASALWAIEPKSNWSEKVSQSLMIDSETVQNVLASITACESGVQDLQKELEKIQQPGGSELSSKLQATIKRLQYPFREGTLLKLRALVSDLRDNLSLAVNTLQLQNAITSAQQMESLSSQIVDVDLGITMVGSRVNFMADHHRNEESQKVVDWISTLSFYDTQIDTLSRRQKGTGQWLFESPEFKSWISLEAKVLWCSGQPGAGKTVLASAIIDELETNFVSPNVALAFIYCNYKQRAKQTLPNLIGSILQQLIHRRGSAIPHEVQQVYELHKQKKTRPSNTDFSSVLRSLLGKFSRTFIVVDALDECSAEEGVRTQFIKELLNLPDNVQVLCTSRHLGDLEDSFSGFPRLEIKAKDTDVVEFLNAEILQVPRLLGFCQRSKDLQATIVSKIVEKSEGMFLLAQLYVDSLTTKTTLGQVRRALDNLPGKLSDVYEDALYRIKSQSEDESRLAMTILSWIVHGQTSLTIGQIQHAVAIMDLPLYENSLQNEDIPEEQVIITVCGGIVSIDQESKILRLVHYTTQEFFDKRRAEIFPNAHLLISQACLRYISLAPFLEGPLTEKYKIKQRLEDYELFTYAFSYFVDHARLFGLSSSIERFYEFFNNNALIGSASQLMWATQFGYDSEFSQPSKALALSYAASFGLDILVERYLASGQNVNEADGDEDTALHGAVKFGRLQTTRLLLVKGADPNMQDREGNTPMHLAGLYVTKEMGLSEIINMLLEKGADAGMRNKDGHTLFHPAAYRGDIDMVEILLKAGTNVNSVGKVGETPLHQASHSGKVEVARLLIDWGADINARHDRMDTPLIWACSMNHHEVVKLLIEKGADIEAEGYGGLRPLHWAAHNGSLPILQLLLHNNVKLDSRTSLYKSALHIAVEESRMEAVQCLLDAGLDPKAKASYGATPLHAAATVGSFPIARMLLEKGADPEAAGWRRRSMSAPPFYDKPIHLAVYSNSLDIVELLLEKGADINSRVELEMSALDRAAEDGKLEIVRLLLDKGADINAAGESGTTPLKRAFRKEHLSTIRLLVERGADTKCVPELSLQALFATESNDMAEYKQMVGKYTLGDEFDTAASANKS